MSKVNEPVATYYSRPQINALKKKLKASIERENNLDVLLQCESLMSSQTTPKYDDVYFEEMEKELGCLKGVPMPCCYTDEELDEVIRESEKSGMVDEEEVNAFFERWKNML